MTYRVTLLEQLRVVREDGSDVGRLMDMRIRARLGPIRHAESPPVDALLVGAKEWLDRLGFRQSAGIEVKPRTVSSIERDRIIVRAATLKRRVKRGEGGRP
jgi:sporulation protein YlmC with PRC-barrel domain